MRILERQKINFSAFEYDSSLTDGVAVAQSLKKAESMVFKTLVTTGGAGSFVFVIPVGCTLDLKKAAATVRTKALEMLKQKDLLPLTGYIHGGCSPIGMKKQLVTVIDDSARQLEHIVISAGKRGFQVELDPFALAVFTGAIFANVTQ